MITGYVLLYPSGAPEFILGY